MSSSSCTAVSRRSKVVCVNSLVRNGFQASSSLVDRSKEASDPHSLAFDGQQQAQTRASWHDSTLTRSQDAQTPASWHTTHDSSLTRSQKQAQPPASPHTTHDSTLTRSHLTASTRLVVMAGMKSCRLCRSASVRSCVRTKYRSPNLHRKRGARQQGGMG